jgi:hypothetical protein
MGQFWEFESHCQHLPPTEPYNVFKIQIDNLEKVGKLLLTFNTLMTKLFHILKTFWRFKSSWDAKRTIDCVFPCHLVVNTKCVLLFNTVLCIASASINF